MILGSLRELGGTATYLLWPEPWGHPMVEVESTVSGLKGPRDLNNVAARPCGEIIGSDSP